MWPQVYKILTTPIVLDYYCTEMYVPVGATVLNIETTVICTSSRKYVPHTNSENKGAEIKSKNSVCSCQHASRVSSVFKKFI
jgi:hypothetical protein